MSPTNVAEQLCAQLADIPETHSVVMSVPSAKALAASHGALREAAHLALAFALVKWGNLDKDANAAFEKVRAALDQAGA